MLIGCQRVSHSADTVISDTHRLYLRELPPPQPACTVHLSEAGGLHAAELRAGALFMYQRRAKRLYVG